LTGGVQISKLPKLMIKIFGHPGEDVCELEQAGYLFNFDDRMIMVEGQRVYSYDDLVRLAAQDKYKNTEFLEIVVLPTIVGG
jgi:hypothetical protein